MPKKNNFNDYSKILIFDTTNNKIIDLLMTRDLILINSDKTKITLNNYHAL
jgi:hypothetical protein